MIAFLVFWCELFALGLLVCLLAMCLFVVIAWLDQTGGARGTDRW